MCAAVLKIATSILITNLGSNSFRVREAAQYNLVPIAPLILDALEEGQKSDNGEVAARCGRLLFPYAERIAWERAGKMRPRLPWLCLEDSYCGEENVRWVQESHKQGIQRGNYENWWEDHRVACRLWLKGQLLAGHKFSDLQDHLDRMVAREAWWTLEQLIAWGLPRYLPARM